MADSPVPKFEIKSTAAYSKLAGFAVMFILLGTVFYHQVEHLKWLDSFYFTVITLATVGYGDIVPHTDRGKLFTVFYVFVGIVIFLALARIVLTGFALRVQRYNQQNQKTKK